MTAVLGIDSGGTKTQAVFVGEAGEVLDLISGPGLDPTNAQDAEAELGQFLSRLTGSGPALQAATVGLPYYGEVAKFTAMQTRVAAEKLGSDARACNDVEVAHIGAFGGGEGVLCLSGTGSMAWAKGPKGTVRAGGFGDLIGDEGSAFWIGQRALALLSQQVDGRRPESDFGAALAQAIGTAPGDLIDWTYNHANARAGVASVALHVSALAAAGHCEAEAILRAAGAELAATARAAAKAAGLSEPSPLACAGSVFSDPHVRDELAHRLGSKLVPSLLPPVGGAALDAAMRAGWSLDEQWISALRDGLKHRGVA